METSGREMEINVDLVQQVPPHVCLQGCIARYPVCAYGWQVYEQARKLAMLVPDPWPDVPRREDIEAFMGCHYLSDVWLLHIGEPVGDGMPLCVEQGGN